MGGVAGAAIDIIAAVSPLILVTTMFGYSRELEKEADLRGVDVMSIAEYPPEEMVKALTLLSNDIEGEQLKFFYNDHPQLKDRIGYVTAYLGSKANKVTAAAELHREKRAYLTNIETVSHHDIQLAINSARFRTAVYLSKKFADFRPDSSENIFWLADSYRALGPRSPELTEKELTNNAKKDAAKNNQQKAEELYLKSLKLDNPVPIAHRGLGMLYEKTGRTKEAIDEYQKYLDLAPNALDRERVQRRIQTLKGSGP